MNMTNLVKGLRTLRTASIIGVVAAFFSIVSGIVMLTTGMLAIGTGTVSGGIVTGSESLVLASGVSGLVAIIGLIFVLVAGIMEIVGLAKTSAMHEGYKKALILVLAEVVISVLIMLVPLSLTINKVLSVIPIAASCLAVYFIISATVTFLENKGDKDLAAKGIKVRSLYIVCAAIVVVASLGAIVPMLTSVAAGISSIASIVQLVALFKYIGFLGKSATSLED